MYIPDATYRIQLHQGFRFSQLRELLPYLYELGISTIYASPVMSAVAGSTHGYDVVNPLEINPEIGTLEELDEISDYLKEKNMGWIQDIVPNHMAYTPENPWIFDILERGRESEWYSFFDIIPSAAQLISAPRIMVPVLGKDLDDSLMREEIELLFTENGFSIRVQSVNYPVACNAYVWICSILPGFYKPLSAWSDKIEAFGLLPWQQWDYFKRRIIMEVWEDARLKSLANEYCRYINRDPGLLRELLGFQHYELCGWKTAFSRINYRRFFTVNNLICLRMEDDATFNSWHLLLQSRYRQQQIQGFRIDHADGLWSLAGYLRKLRELTGPDAYIVVEKILGKEEELPADWPVQGTTGYDFLAFSNQLFTVAEGRKKLTEYYRSRVLDKPFADWVFEEKKHFLLTYMAGELDNLMRWLEPLLSGEGPSPSRKETRDALSVLMAAFPVYRMYVDRLPLTGTPRRWMDESFKTATLRAPDLLQALNRLKTVFYADEGDPRAGEIIYFLRRWAQYTAPLAAKGTEDTVFYNYNALPGLNEVGDMPDDQPFHAERFHAYMLNRQQKTPLSMNAGSTHDTKRGEDNRLRINLISRYADEWIEKVEDWKKLNGPFVCGSGHERAPSENDEYLIYQALLGAVPESLHISISFNRRFGAWLIKALREGKKETTWENPDMEYEKACQDFIERILSPGHSFLPVFLAFAGKIISQAEIFSLAQTLLRLTAPGIPDIYQGAELWDLSLVDPDNRLPVDFSLRSKMLQTIVRKGEKGAEAVLDYVNRHVKAGAQKMFLIWKILHFRRRFPDLFSQGEYIPVIAAENGIGYIRKWEDQQLLVMAPLPGRSEQSVLSGISIVHGRWKNILTHQEIERQDLTDFNVLFDKFPVAALHLQNS